MTSHRIYQALALMLAIGFVLAHFKHVSPLAEAALCAGMVVAYMLSLVLCEAAREKKR